jgi:hypothetical protein
VLGDDQLWKSDAALDQQLAWERTSGTAPAAVGRVKSRDVVFDGCRVILPVRR